MTQIDISRLAQITATAARLRAQRSGLWDLYHETAEELRAAMRARSTRESTMRFNYDRDGISDAQLERLDARIAAIRTKAQQQEADARAAGEAFADAFRLETACREYAKRLGIVPLGEDPLQTAFGGVARSS